MSTANPSDPISATPSNPPSEAAAPPVGLVPGRVTVGIPTYNRAELAERAARSVLAQTYPNLELLVSDDLFPGDDSADRIEALRTLFPTRLLRIIRQPQRLGLVGNFDACLNAASGEFFLLLGDDDVLLPPAIERLVAGFTSAPCNLTSAQVGVVWSPARIAAASGGTYWQTQSGPPCEPPATMLAQLWAGNRGPRLSSILARTADLRHTGGFQPKYGYLCDIGAWAGVALAYPHIVCIPEALALYTNHEQSGTSQSAVAEWQRLAYIVHDDLVARAHALGNRSAEQTLRRSRINFLGGITLTILMQTVGRPGGVATALKELIRSPRIMFSPMMIRRYFRDGWKVLRIRRQPAA